MQNIDLNRIRDFLQIVELGNITRAAEALGERKAKLSRNLGLLEQELGVQLVYRTTRQFRLTGPGLSFYQQMKQHFTNLDMTISGLTHVEERMEGTIRLTAPEDLGHQIVTPVVSEFLKLYPQLHFELVYSNQFLDLVNLGIDVAFRIGKLKDSSLLQKKVGKVDFIMVAAKSYLANHSDLTTPDELHKHQCIVFSPSPSEKFFWKMQSGNAKKQIRIKPYISANNFLTVRNLAHAGTGIAYLPRFLANEFLATGELQHILRSWSGEGTPVQITMPSQKNMSYRVRKFVDFSTKRLAEALY